MFYIFFGNQESTKRLQKQLGHHAHNKYHYKYIRHPALHKYLNNVKS